MLYVELLKKHEPDVHNAVQDLIEKAVKYQTHENDILLVAIHGFYNEQFARTIRGKKYSPYVFGNGNEGLIDMSSQIFFEKFRNSITIAGDRAPYWEYIKSTKDWDSFHYHIHLEFLIYLKIWESDYFLKQLYNLCSRLLHGHHYDWHKQVSNSRKSLIENDIILATKKKAPKFYEVIRRAYNRQIRNAIAHSQYRLAGEYINFYNTDPSEGFNLTSILLNEWEEIFHLTNILHFTLFDKINSLDNEYLNQAADKHFGKQIRIIRLDGSIKYEWLKCLPEIPRWIWYRSWAEAYIPKIYIL